jgi:hypothetical protein
LLEVTPSILRSLGKSLAYAAATLFACSSAQGGPLDEIGALSQLPPIDLGKLQSGEIVINRVAADGFSRGIGLESCYFIHAPVSAVGNLLLHWDPTRHRGSDVRIYREYRWPSGPEVFKSLRFSSNTSEDRWFLDHTLAVADGAAGGDLHLSAQEIDLVRQRVPKKEAASASAREANANQAWQEVLRGRSDSFARGGFAAVAPYSTDAAISPGSEVRGLLSLVPKAAKHFQPILNAKPMAANASATVDETVGYWELTQVRSHTTAQLAVFGARKSAESWQLLDCTYYPADTYFMSLNLFQLWPLEGGTIVWQVGLVSAPFRGYLGGVDRFVAGKQMTQETIDTIKTFRGDIEKRR